MVRSRHRCAPTTVPSHRSFDIFICFEKLKELQMIYLNEPSNKRGSRWITDLGDWRHFMPLTVFDSKRVPHFWFSFDHDSSSSSSASGSMGRDVKINLPKVKQTCRRSSAIRSVCGTRSQRSSAKNKAIPTDVRKSIKLIVFIPDYHR